MDASSSSLAIISPIKLLTFAKGSSSFEDSACIVEATRDASCNNSYQHLSVAPAKIVVIAIVAKIFIVLEIMIMIIILGGKGDGGPPRVEGPEGPKFSRFFHSPATFVILSSSLGGLLVEFWWCFEAPGGSNVHVWSSWAVV